MDSNHRSPKAYALQAHAFAALPHVHGGEDASRTRTRFHAHCLANSVACPCRPHREMAEGKGVEPSRLNHRGDCFQGSLSQPTRRYLPWNRQRTWWARRDSNSYPEGLVSKTSAAAKLRHSPVGGRRENRTRQCLLCRQTPDRLG